MERINQSKPSGLNTSGLRTWGMLFLLLGALGQGVLQTRVLGISGTNSQEALLAALSAEGGMVTATLVLIFQAAATCATPIFCFLLVEGFTHTGNFKNYLLRVLGVAALSELPYNLTMSGKLLDLGSRNPVFGLVLCLIMMYLYDRYSQRTTGNLLIKLCVTVAAIIWAEMLSISDGACCVVITAVLWAFRKKPSYRNIMGCTASAACCLISPFYLAAPMGVMSIHFYNGEKGQNNRLVDYLAYPIMLTVVGLAAMFI